MLLKLHKLKCPTNLGLWIKSYLQDRSLQVQVKKSTSTKRNIKAGLPQGGCLSALLFALYINDIAKKLRTLNVHFALFADDITIWCTNKNINKIERNLQKDTKIMLNFANKWG